MLEGLNKCVEWKNENEYRQAMGNSAKGACCAEGVRKRTPPDRRRGVAQKRSLELSYWLAGSGAVPLPETQAKAV